VTDEYRFGHHVIGGAEVIKGLQQSIAEGAGAAQVFPGNPMSYGVADKVSRASYAQELADQLHIITHATYFILTTQPSGEKREKSIQGAVDMLRWTERIGGQQLVVHPGSTKYDLWYEQAWNWLDEVMSMYDGPVELLLETMAGKTALGNRLEHLTSLCDVDHRIGICVDTTHSWSAGFGIEEMCQWPDSTPLIRACHFNVPNQGVKLGSRLDRHSASFAQTDWTYTEIKSLWEAYRHLPCILEGTPQPKADFDVLRSWK
jgi:endonuclease IV